MGGVVVWVVGLWWEGGLERVGPLSRPGRYFVARFAGGGGGAWFDFANPREIA